VEVGKTFDLPERHPQNFRAEAEPPMPSKSAFLKRAFLNLTGDLL